MSAADDLYQDESGAWRRRSIIVGSDPYATARDFTKRKLRVPDVLNDQYGFGQPGHDRPPVGFVPPEDRMVRIRRVNERGHEVTESVRQRDLAAALRAGAELVDEQATRRLDQARRDLEDIAAQVARSLA